MRTSSPASRWASRSWTRTLLAAFPVAAWGCGSSDRGLGPVEQPPQAVATQCIGAPNGTTQTFNEQRVFLESQGWWGERTGNQIPQLGNAEHIHVGMCFPLQKTVSGNITIQVRVLGHNLVPGSVVTTTDLHDPGGGGLPTITWNHTIAQGQTNWVDTQTVTVNTANIQDGLREFRNLTKVVKPGNPGPELHVSSGWCWDIENSATGTEAASGTCVNSPKSTMGRGWYDCFEYKIAEADSFSTASYPYGGVAAGTNFKIYVGLRDGGGDNTTLTGWGVYLNPEFHSNYSGDWQLTGSGAKNGLVTIPGGQMTSGTVERVSLISHASSGATGNGSCNTPTGAGIVPQQGEVSAVMVIPIKVN